MGKLLERPSKAKTESIPELCDGDRMDSDEFLRRYVATKTVHRAELINSVVRVYSYRDPSTGEVQPMSPTGSIWHGLPQMDISFLLRYYSWKTKGPIASAPATVIFPSGENTVDPDALLYLPEELGGRCKVNDSDLLVGAPELLVEVSHSTAKKDSTLKKALYWQEGVLEYVNYRRKTKELDWFFRTPSIFEQIQPEDGVLKSKTFPGLWIDVKAFLDADLDGMIRSLDAGLASPEHAKFVEKLRRARAKRK